MNWTGVNIRDQITQEGEKLERKLKNKEEMTGDTDMTEGELELAREAGR